MFCLFGSFFSLIRGLKRQDPRFRLLGSLSAPVMLFFLIHAFSQKIQANWPGFVYPAAIMADYARVGFRTFICELPAPYDAETLETLAGVVKPMVETALG